MTALNGRGRNRRRLKVYPGGRKEGKGTHMSVFLELLDTMWQPSADFMLTLVNQVDVSKSFSKGRVIMCVWPLCSQCAPALMPAR